MNYLYQNFKYISNVRQIRSQHPLSTVEINEFIYNKLMLYRLYYVICNFSIQLKRLICDNLGCHFHYQESICLVQDVFQQVITQPKLIIWKNHFTIQETTPLDIRHQNISVISPVGGCLLFSQLRPFLALLLNLGCFGNFIPDST